MPSAVEGVSACVNTVLEKIWASEKGDKEYYSIGIAKVESSSCQRYYGSIPATVYAGSIRGGQS